MIATAESSSRKPIRRAAVLPERPPRDVASGPQAVGRAALSMGPRAARCPQLHRASGRLDQRFTDAPFGRWVSRKVAVGDG
jgi:hypothetical protein